MIVLNAVGARQGCAFGTLLYALVQHPILIEVAEQYEDLTILAFADDANFLSECVVNSDTTTHTPAPATSCSACEANALYKHLYGHHLRGELNDAKSSAFSFGITEAQARAAGLAPDIPFGTAELPDGSTATGGMILYGGPIGSPAFVRKFIRAAIDKASLGLSRLSYMDSCQHRLIMLRMSFCKRVQHIQRLVPTHDHLDLLRPYDELLTRAVSDLTLGKGTFHELAGQLLHLPAPLGGLGVDSVAARADATFYSSFLTASIRLSALDDNWFASTYGSSHASLDASQAAKTRLLHTHGMSDLLPKISAHDPPRRVQGKIMNLINRAEFNRLSRVLPDREATVLHSSANSPHLVSISATSDPSLQVANAPFSTFLARRLCITQLPTSSSTDAALSTSHPCPNCGKNHANAHLDQALYCYDSGNPGRFGWHTDFNRTMYALQKACNTHAQYEPGSVASANASQVRCDGRNDTVLPGTAAAHFDVRTATITQPKTATIEAAFPGITTDRLETAKIRKHAPPIRANNPADKFYPIVVNEFGGIGPMGQDFLDLVFRHANNPSMMKTYWQRRLAVNTCNGLHNCLFRPTRGSRTRESSPLPPDTVSHPEHSEASEQTACANDEDLLETRPSPSPGSPAPHRNTEHTSPMDLDDFDFLEHTDNHLQLRPTSDHSQPDPVGSGVIPPVRAASASGTTASQHRQTSDHRHEHLPISLGVIPSPRTDLAPSSTASPTHPPGNHSHEPLPVSSGVTSPHMSLVSAVSAAAASQLRPTSDHSHEPLPGLRGKSRSISSGGT